MLNASSVMAHPQWFIGTSAVVRWHICSGSFVKHLINDCIRSFMKHTQSYLLHAPRCAQLDHVLANGVRSNIDEASLQFFKSF